METNILTKEERHKVYVLAKEIFVKHNADGHQFGLCSSIIKAYTFLWPNRFSNQSFCALIYYFPEFNALKPKHKKQFSYWWSKDNYNIRIKKMDKIIKETE